MHPHYPPALPKLHNTTFLNRCSAIGDCESRFISPELHSSNTKRCRATLFGDGIFCATALLFFRCKSITRQIHFHGTDTHIEEQCPESRINWKFFVQHRDEDAYQRRILEVYQQVQRFSTPVRDSVPYHSFRSICHFYENHIFCTQFSSCTVLKEGKHSPSTTIPIKIFSANRRVRKLIGVSSYEDLETKCIEKYGLNENPDIKFVLDDDGVEVDRDGYTFLTPNSTLMMLVGQEVWHPRNFATETGAGEGQLQTSVQLAEYIENLKEKVTAKRKASSSLGQAGAVKKIITTKLSPGWKHYSYAKGDYIQIRSRKTCALPTGDMIFTSDMDYKNCLSKMENLYFKNGTSLKGKLSTMETKLGSCKGEIRPEGFSPLQFSQESGTAKPKLYLLTKKKIPSILCITESESSDDLPDLGFLQSNSRQENNLTNLTPVSTQENNLANLTPVSIQENSLTNLTPLYPSMQSGNIQQRTFASPSRDTRQSTYTNLTHVPTSIHFTHIHQTPSMPGGNTEQMPTFTPSRDTREASTFSVHADTPTIQMALPNQMRTCAVCADRETDSIIWPCVHSICFPCGIHLQENGQSCPLCRGSIEQVRVVHYN